MNPLKTTIGDTGERPSGAPHQDEVRAVYLYCMAWPCWRLHTGSWQRREGTPGEETCEQRPGGIQSIPNAVFPMHGFLPGMVGIFEYMTP